MRALRLVLAFIPFVVVLGTLAAAELWHAFWIVAVVSLITWTGALAVVRSLRADRRAGRRMTGTELTGLLARRWWVFGLASAALATAGFYPGLRKEGWWVPPAYAVAIFLVIGIVVRMTAMWVGKYEQEFETFTRRRDPPKEPTEPTQGRPR